MVSYGLMYRFPFSIQFAKWSDRIHLLNRLDQMLGRRQFRVTLLVLQLRINILSDCVKNMNLEKKTFENIL